MIPRSPPHRSVAGTHSPELALLLFPVVDRFTGVKQGRRLRWLSICEPQPQSRRGYPAVTIGSQGVQRSAGTPCLRTHVPSYSGDSYAGRQAEPVDRTGGCCGSAGATAVPQYTGSTKLMAPSARRRSGLSF